MLTAAGLSNKQRYKRSGSSGDEEQLNKNINLFTILLKNNVKEKDKINQLREALQQGADINFQDANRGSNTLLHIAVKKGYLGIIFYLLKETSVKVDLKNKKGEIPKDLAAGKKNIIDVLELSPQSSHRVSPNQGEQSVSVSLSHRQLSANQEKPLSSQQVGWNCFDVAIDLAGRLGITASEPEKRAKQARKKLVSNALMESSNEDYRKLLAPEIRHAAVLTVAAMNANAGNQADGYLLPNGMRTDALKDLYNRYSSAFEQEETKAALAFCNGELGNGDGQRKSWDELQAFFQDNGNRGGHPGAYAEFNKAKSIIEPAEKAFSDYCLQENTYRQYIQEYYGNNEWFAFQADGSTSMVDVVAKLLSIRITVYDNNHIIIRQTADYGAAVSVKYNGVDHFIAIDSADLVHSGLNQQPGRVKRPLEAIEREGDIGSKNTKIAHLPDDLYDIRNTFNEKNIFFDEVKEYFSKRISISLDLKKNDKNHFELVKLNFYRIPNSSDENHVMPVSLFLFFLRSFLMKGNDNISLRDKIEKIVEYNAFQIFKIDDKNILSLIKKEYAGVESIGQIELFLGKKLIPTLFYIWNERATSRYLFSKSKEELGREGGMINSLRNRFEKLLEVDDKLNKHGAEFLKDILYKDENLNSFKKSMEHLKKEMLNPKIIDIPLIIKESKTFLDLLNKSKPDYSKLTPYLLHILSYMERKYGLDKKNKKMSKDNIIKRSETLRHHLNKNSVEFNVLEKIANLSEKNDVDKTDDFKDLIKEYFKEVVNEIRFYLQGIISVFEVSFALNFQVEEDYRKFLKNFFEIKSFSSVLIKKNSLDKDIFSSLEDDIKPAFDYSESSISDVPNNPVEIIPRGEPIPDHSAKKDIYDYDASNFIENIFNDLDYSDNLYSLSEDNIIIMLSEAWNSEVKLHWYSDSENTVQKIIEEQKADLVLKEEQQEQQEQQEHINLIIFSKSENKKLINRAYIVTVEKNKIIEIPLILPKIKDGEFHKRLIEESEIIIKEELEVKIAFGNNFILESGNISFLLKKLIEMNKPNSANSRLRSVDLYDVTLVNASSLEKLSMRDLIKGHLYKNLCKLNKIIEEKDALSENKQKNFINCLNKLKNIKLKDFLPYYEKCLQKIDNNDRKNSLSILVVQALLGESTDTINARDNGRKTPLHLAVFENHLEIVKTLLDKGAGINVKNYNTLLNKQDNHGAIPLHWAAFRGHLGVIQYMVGINKDLLNKQDSCGTIPLHWAALGGHLEVVEYMVGIDKDLLNKQNNHDIRLHWAAFEGHSGVVKYMISKVLLNRQDNQGDISLRLAAFKRRLEVVQCIDKALFNEQDNQGDIPLHLAALKRHLGIVKYRVGKAILNKQDNQDDISLHLAAFEDHLGVVQYMVGIDKELLNKQDNQGDIPLLYWAAFKGPSEVIKYRVGKAILNKQDNQGDIPLLHLVTAKHHLEVIKYRVGKELLNKQDNQGDIPLRLVVLKCHLEVVQYMVDIDKELLNEQDNQGDILLHLAVLKRHLEVVQYMVDIDKELLNEQDNQGDILLHLAVLKRHLEVAQYRVGKAILNKQDNQDDISLHLAVLKNHLEVAQYMVGIDKELLNEQDNQDDIPLHLAALKRHLGVVKYRVGKAILNKQDNQGDISLHLAALESRLGVVQYMVSIDKELLNKQDNQDDISLHLAVLKNHLEVVQYMVSIDKELLNEQDNQDDIPLHLAALKRHLGVIKCRVGKAPLNKQDNQGDISIHLAALESRLEVVKYRVGKELLNKQDNQDDISLHLAAFENHLEVVKYRVGKELLNKQDDISLHLATLNIETDTSSSESEIDTNNEVISSNKKRVRRSTNIPDNKRFKSTDSLEKVKQAMASDNGTSKVIGEGPLKVEGSMSIRVHPDTIAKM